MTKIWGWMSILCFLTAAWVCAPFVFTGQHGNLPLLALPLLAGAVITNRLDWKKRGIKA